MENNNKYSSPLDNKPFPHDVDTEKALLGAVIIEGKIIKKLIDILDIDDFYTTKHQKIYSAMREMHKNDKGIDILTLGNYFMSTGCYDDIGGGFYLAHLKESNPTTILWEDYADHINELSVKRKLVDKFRRLTSKLLDNKIDSKSVVMQLQDLNYITKNNSKLVPISAKDLNEDYEPVQTLWGEIIYPSSITQINSEPGVGKTTFFYNLCLNGVTGNNFLDIAFTKKLKVLYIDVETPHWKRALKLRTISVDSLPKNLYFLNTLELQTDFPYLLNLCKREKYDLVVFDTQSRIFSLTQENDNSEANRLMGLLRRLANDTGCSIVLIHHTSKSDTPGAYRGRGASAVGAAVDVVVNMEMLEEDVIKLKVDKNRIMGDYQTLFIRKIGEDQFEPFTPSNESLSGFEKFKAQDLILSLASQKSIWTTSELYSEGEKQGFSESAMKRAKDNLTQTGKMRKVKHGVYEIVSKGQKVKSSDPIGGNNELLNFSRKTFEQMPEQPSFE